MPNPTVAEFNNLINNLIYGNIHSFHNKWADEGKGIDQIFTAFPTLNRADITGTIGSLSPAQKVDLKFNYIFPCIQSEFETVRFYIEVLRLGYANMQELITDLPKHLNGDKLTKAITACTEAKQALTVLLPLIGDEILTLQLGVMIAGADDLEFPDPVKLTKRIDRLSQVRV